MDFSLKKPLISICSPNFLIFLTQKKKKKKERKNKAKSDEPTTKTTKKNETHEARTKASQFDIDRQDERTKQNQMNPQANP